MAKGCKMGELGLEVSALLSIRTNGALSYRYRLVGLEAQLARAISRCRRVILTAGPLLWPDVRLVATRGPKT
jgi:hypothetical protein